MDNIHRPTLSPLPASAMRKLDQIERLAADAVALTQTAQNQIRDLELQVPQALNIVDTANDPDQRRAAQADLDALEHRIAERRDEVTKRRRRAEECSQVVAQIREFQAKRPRNASFVTIAAPVSMRDGETIKQALDRVRNEIASKHNELAQIALAMPPMAELRDQVKREVNTYRLRGAPPTSLIGGQFRIDLGLVPGAPISMERALGLLAWCVPDVLEQALVRGLESLPTSGERLPSDLKAARTGTLTREIMVLERQEESLVSAALENGDPVSRRENANPLAILGIGFASQAEAVAA